MKGALRWVELILLAVAVVALGWYGAVRVQEWRYQRSAQRALKMGTVPISQKSTQVSKSEKRGQSPFPARIEILRLGMSAMVKPGVDDGTLRHAVGHVPDTALPGEPGNAAFAGHRDTFFRPLRKVRRGDRVRVTTPDGIHEYVVRNTKVVAPSDVSVLNPTRGRTLTLITCYPFNFIGSAPKRFIVQATAPAAATPAAVTYASVMPGLKAASTLSVSDTGTAKPKIRKATKSSKARVSRTKSSNAQKRPGQKSKKGFWKKLGGLFS